MESPVRKMLKRNDYNRHKLFRKIKRRNKARAEQESKIAEKELKRRLRWTAPKFDIGKDQYNFYSSAFDSNGNLKPELTVTTPEVNVVGRRNNGIQQYYDLQRRMLFEDMLKRHSEIQPGTGEVTVGNGALERVYPEFDVLSLGRSLYNDLIPSDLFYRKTAILAKEMDKNLNKNGLFDAYYTNPQNLDRGDILDYQDYVTSIFPKSTYQNIVYHGGPKGILQIKNGIKNPNINTATSDHGFYLTFDKDLAEYYARSYGKNKGLVYPMVIDAQNVMRYDNPRWITDAVKGWLNARFSPDAITNYWYDRLGLKNIDAIFLHKSGSPFARDQITMFDPNKTKILGTRQDAKDFAEYMMRNNSSLLYKLYDPESIQNTSALWNVTPKNITTALLKQSPMYGLLSTPPLLTAKLYNLLKSQNTPEHKAVKKLERENYRKAKKSKKLK